MRTATVIAIASILSLAIPPCEGADLERCREERQTLIESWDDDDELAELRGRCVAHGEGTCVHPGGPIIR